jgi:hypothetical protein
MSAAPSATGFIVCSACGAGVRLPAERCWMCGAAVPAGVGAARLPAGGPRAGLTTSEGPERTRTEGTPWAEANGGVVQGTAMVPREAQTSGTWLVVAALLAVVFVVIFVTLLLESPGLAVLFGAVALPVVGGIAAVAHGVAASRRAARHTGALDARGDVRPAGTRDVGAAMAKGALIVVLVLVGLALMAVVGIVLVFVLCLAIIGGMTYHGAGG